MEDLFELLITLLLVVFAFVTKRNKKMKKKAENKPAKASKPAAAEPAPHQTEAQKPAKPAQAAFNEALEALTELLEDLPDPAKPTAAKPTAVKVREQTSIEAETAAKERAQQIQADVQVSMFGESLIDEHGCVGGSMPVHTAEGETLAEHAVHEHNRTERLEAESAAVRTEQLRKPNLTELRRAVIMSEILDKPVSLRRRRI